MEFISIGPFCSMSVMLKDYNVKNKSYPFDNIFSSLELVKHAINDRFSIFLDKKYYKNGLEPVSMYHTFYQDYIDTELLKKHHDVHGHYSIGADLKNREIFLHHNLLDNPVDYETYSRRCKRLLDLIDNNKKIVFVYYNPYTYDYQDLLDFYSNFSSNKNIFVIGVFENDRDKTILFENENCKIFQNYDPAIIFTQLTG